MSEPLERLVMQPPQAAPLRIPLRRALTAIGTATRTGEQRRLAPTQAAGS